MQIFCHLVLASLGCIPVQSFIYTTKTFRFVVGRVCFTTSTKEVMFWLVLFTCPLFYPQKAMDGLNEMVKNCLLWNKENFFYILGAIRNTVWKNAILYFHEMQLWARSS